MQPPSRFRQINGNTLKKHRLNRGWSQSELARKAGYSERLIRKAEAGGSLSFETIADLAEALSDDQRCIAADHLLFDDHLSMAQQFVKGYDELGANMVQSYSHLFADHVLIHCPADPQQVPFAGEWHGIDGLQQFLNHFFSIFVRVPLSLSPSFMVGEGRVSARYDDRLIFKGIVLPPFWVNLHFHFEQGLIARIDDEYDTKNAALALDEAIAQLRGGAASSRNEGKPL